MISKFSVKKPYTVLVGVVMIIVLGIVSFTKMSTDLLPNINLPYVIVMTTYVGASPETVEMVVTKPIEASMATVSNVENISSVSNENYSLVILEFAQSANMDSVSLDIRESLDRVSSYWDDSVGSPIIMKLNPDMLPIMVAAVGVEGMSNAEISDYTTTTLLPELESIEGVASASASGLLEESVHVVIRQDKIDAINEQVFGAVDEKMADAEKELADGKKELADGRKKLAEGWEEIDSNIADLEKAQQDLIDGKQEVADKKADMETAEQELKDKKDEAATQLAEKYAQVIAAKDKITEGKAALILAIAQIEEGVKPLDMETIGSMSGLEEEIATLQGGASPTDLVTISPTDPIYTTIAGLLQNPAWLQSYGTWEALSTAVSNAIESDAFKKLTALYQSWQESTAKLAELTAAEVKLEEALKALTKGEIEAAAGFGSADAMLTMGKTQLEASEKQFETGQKQIDSGLEQIESAKDQLRDSEDQLRDAEEQLKDGQKQLADAKEQAYASADMNGILTVDTVKSLLTAQNFSMPGGYIVENGVDYLIRVGDKPEDVETLAAMPLMNVNMEGVDVITLSDVADVFMTDNNEDIYTNVNGSSGVIVSMQKQTGYSTGDVSNKINDKFEKLMAGDSSLKLISLMDQGVYIDMVMDSILNNILFGAGLAILILILFLKDIRPTLVIAFSIPISLVAAIVCMYFSGVTLNIISLSGLALGIGMLVDNSIVVIENIYRMRNEGVSMKEAATEGAGEVAGAIVASTLTTVCVFAPIVFTEGITRQLFVDMGLTIAYSLLASLVIALTVVPAMASKLLTQTKEEKQGPIFGKIIAVYGKVLELALKWKPLVLLGAVVLLIVSGMASASKGIAFMPEMDSNQLALTLTLPKETPLAETAEVTDEVVERLAALEDVKDVGAMLGSGSMSLGMGGADSTNSSVIYVVTTENKKQTTQELAKDIEELLSDLENVELSIQTSSMDMTAMSGSGIAIQVRGRELDTLRKIAGEVAAVVSGVEGTEEVSDGMEENSGELRIVVDRNKAIEYSLTVAQVFQQIYSKTATPTSATTLTTEIKEFDVFVTNEADSRLTRETIQQLPIDYTDKDGNKKKVALSELASFEETESLKSIQREAQTRYISVSAAIADGYNVGLVARDVEEALKTYKLPEGYHLEFSGENETILDALGQLMLMLILAIVFMYLIMVAQFQSLLSPFIIMFTIPLAFTGGFLGLYLSNSEISVIAMIGFVMLSGIIVNNGIVLVDYMNQLREAGMAKKEAILEAGKTRLRPVLMTALTTILALSTMVFSKDMGADMSKPMSIVTIGGLVYGTLLTLVVIPCIYDLFSREKTESFPKSKNEKN